MLPVNEFLVHIYGSRSNDVWVVGVAGDPAASFWQGGPAGSWLSRIGPNDNGFFCIGLLKPGATRRAISTCQTVHCIVFDDVGTKGDAAALEALLGPPTWKIESSPGNFQWGYKYKTPVDQDGFALHKAIINKGKELGICDGISDVVRLVRLPVGTNGKCHPDGTPKYPGWKVALTEWNPSVDVDILDVAMALGVQDGDLSRAWTSTSSRKFDARIGDDKDPWMIALESLGMVLRDNPKPGVVDIECPFEHEHTVRSETGSSYLGSGKFECHHGHCLSKNSTHFRAEIAGRFSEQESGGLVDGFALLGALAFDRVGGELDAEEMAILDTLGRAWGVASVEEALERLVLVHDLEAWFDRVTRRVQSHRQVDVLLRRVIPYGSSGAKAGHAQLLNEPGLTVVDKVTYIPGQPVLTLDHDGSTAANAWRPNDAVKPVAGGAYLDKILAHMEMLFPDADDRRVIECWMAHQVQRPGVKVPWMILILGGQGIGKDLLLQGLKNVVGTWNVSDVTTEMLDSQFNPWIKAQIVCVQELAADQRFSLYNKLKPLIAAPPETVGLNQKNQRVIELPNLQNWIGTTNNAGAVALAKDDRRIFVLESPAVPQDRDYYRALAEAVDKGRGEFLGWLQDYDLGLAGWEPGRIPTTANSAAAKAQMTVEGMSGAAQRVVLELEEGMFGGRKLIASRELREHMERRGIPAERVDRAIKEAMAALGCRQWRNNTQLRLRTGENPQRVWVRKRPELYEQMDADKLRDAYLSECGAHAAFS
jgi:hypothetical protein